MLVRAQCTLAAHYGEYMIHPVAVTLGLFLISNSIVEVSIQPKTKRDNAFQYVVLHLAGSAHLSVHHSRYRQMQVQNYKNKIEFAPN